MFFITSPGWLIPMDAMPTPALAVPYAAPRSVYGGVGSYDVVVATTVTRQRHVLAKTRAADTPMKPKKAAAHADGWVVGG